jgi:hypothetical protein
MNSVLNINLLDYNNRNNLGNTIGDQGLGFGE